LTRIVRRGRISSEGRIWEYVDSATGRVTKIERLDRNDTLLDTEYFDQGTGRSTHIARFDSATGRVTEIRYFDVSPESRARWTIRAEHFDAVSGVRTKVENFEPCPKYDKTQAAILTSRLRELEVLGRLVDGTADYPEIDAEARSVIEGVRARLYHKLKELTRYGENEKLARQLGVLDGLAQVRQPLPGVGWPKTK
jgi:hypothetical protein